MKSFVHFFTARPKLLCHSMSKMALATTSSKPSKRSSLIKSASLDMDSQQQLRTATTSSQPSKRSSLLKSASLDSQDSGVETLGDDTGLGRILLGIRYHRVDACLEVRIAKGENLRSLPASEEEDQQPQQQLAVSKKPSTYCTVSFMPEKTKPTSTPTVENSENPSWRGVFMFRKFSWAASTNQRCLLIQVIDADSGKAMSETTMLLDNRSHEASEKGLRVWKYLNGTKETQHISDKQGNAFMTLLWRSNRFKLTLNRIEDLNLRACELSELQLKLQATVAGRVLKEAALNGYRIAPDVDVAKFFDGELSVRVGKHGHEGLSLRLVLTCQVAGASQDLYWLDLGANASRTDCRNLYQSVIENPNQPQFAFVQMNKAPVPEPEV